MQQTIIRMLYRSSIRSVKGFGSTLYLNFYARAIVKDTFKKYRAHLTRTNGPVAGVCESSNEHSCFIRSRDFLYSIFITFSKMDFLYGIRKLHWRSSVNIH
jgi:hypothetical protein